MVADPAIQWLMEPHWRSWRRKPRLPATALEGLNPNGLSPWSAPIPVGIDKVGCRLMIRIEALPFIKIRRKKEVQCGPHHAELLCFSRALILHIGKMVFRNSWNESLLSVPASQPAKIASAKRRHFRHTNLTLPFGDKHIFLNVFTDVANTCRSDFFPVRVSMWPILLLKALVENVLRLLRSPEQEDMPMTSALIRAELSDDEVTTRTPGKPDALKVFLYI